MIPLLASIPPEAAHAAASQFDGYIYPNEQNLLWSVLIVVYPYVTGLVAGAFIMASLVRVFKVHALAPAYRLALLTALAFLITAPLPLLLHLGHPERCLEVMMTPHFSSPMAMFGFVYAWYIMAVLLLELWFDYRRDLVVWGRQVPGFRGWLYRLFTVGVDDLSPKAIDLDEKMCDAITIIGIPSAFLLHGYVGFIFGSVKANPWWGNVLMPIIFIFSAIVSGIALCVILYYFITWVRGKKVEVPCVEEMGKFLFYALLVDASVEGLDWLHRLYSAEEDIHVLKELAAGRLFYSLLIGQMLVGTVLPLLMLGSTQIIKPLIPVWARTKMYLLSALCIVSGVMAMRWNVVIGGQLFSKSLRGFTTYKMELHGQEGWLVALALMALPYILLFIFIKLFLREDLPTHEETLGDVENHGGPAAAKPAVN